MTKVAEVRKADPKGTALVVPDNTPNSITLLLDKALDKNIDPASLEKLVTLYERVQENNARSAFFNAMAEFQRRCPPIPKDKKIDYTTRSGVRINFNYAPLPTIAREIDPICADLGLSYSWDSKDEGAKLVTTCSVRHVAGHSEGSSFACPTANNNPGMSDQQKASSALTFAMRQSLIQAFGLTSADVDDDTVLAEQSQEPVTDEQADTITALLDEVTVDRPRFLKWLGVGSIAEIRANDYARAIATLEQKRGGKLIRLDMDQGSLPWIQARLGIPTASNFDKILTPKKMQLSAAADGYAHQLIAEKLLGHPLDEAETAWMQRGTLQEKSAVDFYEMERGVDTDRVGLILRDDRRVGCSPDRLVGKNGGMEIKVPSAKVHIGYLLDTDGIGYKTQVQGCLWLCEREWWDTLSYNPDLPNAVVRQHRDDAFIKVLAQTVDQFLNYRDEMIAKLAKLGVPGLPAIPDLKIA